MNRGGGGGRHRGRGRGGSRHKGRGRGKSRGRGESLGLLGEFLLVFADPAGQSALLGAQGVTSFQCNFGRLVVLQVEGGNTIKCAQEQFPKKKSQYP